MLNFETFGITHIGLVRKRNEDSFFFDENKKIFCIADGLGALPDGDRASKLACQAVEENSDKDLLQIFEKASEKVLSFPTDHPELEVPMGSTLTVLQIKDDYLTCANIGDSGLYLIRNGQIKQITIDQTIAQDLINQGESLNKIDDSLYHCLTACVGMRNMPEPDIFNSDLQKQDYLMLYTDGITKHFTEEEVLAAFLKENNSIKDIANYFISQANIRGGNDNITCIIIKVI